MSRDLVTVHRDLVHSARRVVVKVPQSRIQRQEFGARFEQVSTDDLEVGRDADQNDDKEASDNGLLQPEDTNHGDLKDDQAISRVLKDMSEEPAAIFVLSDVAVGELVLEDEEGKAEMGDGSEKDQRADDGVNESDDQGENALWVVVVVLEAPRNGGSLKGARCGRKFPGGDERVDDQLRPDLDQLQCVSAGVEDDVEDEEGRSRGQVGSEKSENVCWFADQGEDRFQDDGSNHEHKEDIENKEMVIPPQYVSFQSRVRDW